MASLVTDFSVYIYIFVAFKKKKNSNIAYGLHIQNTLLRVGIIEIFLGMNPGLGLAPQTLQKNCKLI